VQDDVLLGGIEKRDIVVVPYDPAWRAKFERHAAMIREALGATALRIEHVGSTSVPGLAAKPIIDILVEVADSADEARYLPALLGIGYALRVREPDWHEHRMVRTPALDVHVHVFSVGCTETRRQLAFRNRLRRHEGDRLRYQSLKQELAKEPWPDMNAYARAKTAVVEEITVRALEEGAGPHWGDE
jgi:GrpB-like predicted nucleotidyltransferase (UPF0157 family)